MGLKWVGNTTRQLTTSKESPRLVGISNGPIQFESARKIWPLDESLAKLDECLLARARKIFASARMLGFWLKFPTSSVNIICILKQCFPWKTLGKHAHATNVSEKTILVLLTFIETDRPEFSPR